MAVSNSIIKTEYPKNPKQILVADELAFTLGVLVGNTGLSAGSDGKKILKAGTPIAGDILARNTAFKKATTTPGLEEGPDTTDAVGILLHDVDVTNGDANGTIVIFGFVDMLKLDTDVQSLIDDAVKSTLTKITFIKGQ